MEPLWDLQKQECGLSPLLYINRVLAEFKTLNINGIKMYYSKIESLLPAVDFLFC